MQAAGRDVLISVAPLVTVVLDGATEIGANDYIPHLPSCGGHVAVFEYRQMLHGEWDVNMDVAALLQPVCVYPL